MRHLFSHVVLGACFALATSSCTAAGSSTVIGGGSPSSSGSSGETVIEQPAGNDVPEDTGPVDYEALFGPPSSTDATPDSLTGLWAGTTSGGDDMRIKFGPTSIILAVKCDPDTIGMRVAARVNASSIKVVESKTEKSSSSSSLGCQISVKPDERTACTADEFSKSCFQVKGTKLSLGGPFLGSNGSQLTKLSD